MRKTTFLGETIGGTIRGKRKKQKMSIEDLADAADLNDKFLGEVERGEKIPSIHTIMKLAKPLNLKESRELLVDVDEKVYPTIKKGNQEEV